MRERLLAKSPHDGIEKTVLEHTIDVVDSAIALFGTAESPTRLGSRFATMFRVNDPSRFARNVILAAALHDVGKANHQFQFAIEASAKGRTHRQAIRHEHVSAILICCPFGDVIRQNTDVDWLPVFGAVVGHHRKTNFQIDLTKNDTLPLNTDSPEFQQLVVYLSERTGLAFDPQKLPCTLTARQIDDAIDDQVLNELGFLEDLNGAVTDERVDLKLMAIAVRAALIVADVAGSALAQDQMSPADWIAEAFDEATLINHDSIRESVIDPRISQITGGSNDDFIWSDFQDNCALLPTRALLLAPCGSGKSLAAWRWIAEQAADQIRHAIFLYPTRATATEGFKDYVAWAPEAEAALMHGSAAYELETLFQNPPDFDGDQRVAKSLCTDSTLNSLSFWKKQYFSATVDQFLAFTRWDHHSVCLLPLLADAALIVDEVHSFDDKMFDSLVDLLEQTNVPILCMTATLTGARRNRLEKHLSCPFKVLDAYQEDFVNLRKVDDEPRYELKQIEAEQAHEVAKNSVARGLKVLWVVNTVARAQSIYASLLESENALIDPRETHCYHSRFRLHDRQRHHDCVVAAFKPQHQRAVIAVTTQVCEMGLDLDADVLITELCPPSSIVQRMGRCNRASIPRDTAGKIYLYKPESPRPYREDIDLIGSDELVALVTGIEHRFSQRQLNQWLVEISQATEVSSKITSFFECGPIRIDGFRDIAEYTDRAILDCDIEPVKRRIAENRPYDGYILPVPKFPSIDLEDASRPLPRWLKVASETNYYQDRGYIPPKAESSEVKQEQQWQIL